MTNEWCEPLLSCCEGLYILEEKTKKIIWANSFIAKGIKDFCLGEPCWKVFLHRDGPCSFCPTLTMEDGVYVWDYYAPIEKRWLKVKQLVFNWDGVLYRAGNINMIDEVMHLNYETVQEISMLQSLLTQNNRAMMDIRKGALYDTLTGLLNRNCFQMDLEEEYAHSPGLGVLYLDINNLKEINDSCRHSAGDTLLRRTAHVMQMVSRQAQPSKCYRIGGDEFVMLFKNCTEEKLAGHASLFKTYLENCNRNQPHSCSVAIGMAFSEAACDPEQLVSQADKDMYVCKQQMKG